MPELQNFKRKRANRSSYVVNPDGNCTPSDSDTDDEESDRFNQRKIVRRRQSNDNDVNEIELNDGSGHDNGDAGENSNQSNATESTESQWSQGNSQLLYAALEKLQELESELAELDEADYDSGHHDDEDDDDDIDEGNDSDFDENAPQQRQQQQQQQQHDHRNEILDGEAEALGFAFCVKETFEYLAAQGVGPDNPIISSLRERFLGQCNRAPFQ